jgi:hypothetical protein
MCGCVCAESEDSVMRAIGGRQAGRKEPGFSTIADLVIQAAVGRRAVMRRGDQRSADSGLVGAR